MRHRGSERSRPLSLHHPFPPRVYQPPLVSPFTDLAPSASKRGNRKHSVSLLAFPLLFQSRAPYPPFAHAHPILRAAFPFPKKQRIAGLDPKTPQFSLPSVPLPHQPSSQAGRDRRRFLLVLSPVCVSLSLTFVRFSHQALACGPSVQLLALQLRATKLPPPLPLGSFGGALIVQLFRNNFRFVFSGPVSSALVGTGFSHLEPTNPSKGLSADQPPPPPSPIKDLFPPFHENRKAKPRANNSRRNNPLSGTRKGKRGRTVRIFL